MDLGAGTSITVMDFFLASPLSMLVMLPERPAVLNAFNFLKNALFRVLERSFKQNNNSERVLSEYRCRGRGPGAMKTAELIKELDKTMPGSGEKAWARVKQLRPKLVLNRARKVDDFVYARQLERWVADDLGIQVEVLGFLPEDDILRKSAAQGAPALDVDPRAPFCRALAMLGLRLIEWAGKGQEWAAYAAFGDSFTRAATEFAPLFPPPGTSLPTREELIRRLKELESQLKD
jgi:flagellar biosynthesis protein FlhG